MALCSLSPSTNHRLISHSWTSPSTQRRAHMLGAHTHTHTCTCNCCVHTYGLPSKKWTKGPTQMILISGYESHTRTHTHTKEKRHARWWPSKPKICPSDKVTSSDMVQHGRGSQLDCLQIRKNPLCDQAIQVEVPHKKQTSTWPARRTHPISPGLLLTAY